MGNTNVTKEYNVQKERKTNTWDLCLQFIPILSIRHILHIFPFLTRFLTYIFFFSFFFFFHFIHLYMYIVHSSQIFEIYIYKYVKIGLTTNNNKQTICLYYFTIYFINVMNQCGWNGENSMKFTQMRALQTYFC